MTEYQQLADLDWSDLVDLRMEVLAENKRLLSLLAGQKRDWMVSKISTPLEDRVDAEADLAETEAGLAQIEVEMARRRSEGRGFDGKDEPARSTIFVFDGYLMQPAEPAFPDHVMVLGADYFVVPEGAYYWSIGHGETGWWNAEDKKGKPMRPLLYSIPKSSPMIGGTWSAIKDAVFKPNGSTH